MKKLILILSLLTAPWQDFPLSEGMSPDSLTWEDVFHIEQMFLNIAYENKEPWALKLKYMEI